MYRDPIGIFSCDLPVGWFPEGDSSAFRLVFRHWQFPRDQLVLSVAATAADVGADDEHWDAAARVRYRLPVGAAPVVVAGTTAICGEWEEGSGQVVRVVCRGAHLDLIADRFADAIDEPRRRDLLRVAASVRLASGPVGAAGGSTDGPPSEDLSAALAEVDRAAGVDGEAFRIAMERAIAVAGRRWIGSMSGLPNGVDVSALVTVATLALRYGHASGNAYRMMQAVALVLRAVPVFEVPMPAVIDPHRDVEDAIASALHPLLGTARRLVARNPAFNAHTWNVDLGGIPHNALLYLLGSEALATVRAEAVNVGEELDHRHAMSMFRSIVESAFYANPDLTELESVHVDAVLSRPEPLVAFVDEAIAADEVQEAAEAAALLCHLARLILAKAETDDEAVRGAARRWLSIGLVALGNVLIRSGDEASLRAALAHNEEARASLALAHGDVQLDLLGLFHQEVMVCLQMGDIERAGAGRVPALTITPSISTLRQLHQRADGPRSGRKAVLGDPATAARHGVGRLPGAAAEAAWLSTRLHADTLTGAEATLPGYRDIADHAGLLHLGCHGIAGIDSQGTALLLAPDATGRDLLTPAEIERVPLRSALVVLAACRSGTGRATSDGTVGLSRAFLRAGAVAVVAALWSVPDIATHDLVLHLYDALLDGTDVAEALRIATGRTRDTLARQYGFESVDDVPAADWGAFFVFGLGTYRLTSDS